MLTVYDHRTAQSCSLSEGFAKMIGRTVTTTIESTVVGFGIGVGAWAAMKLLGIYQVSLVVAK